MNNAVVVLDATGSMSGQEQRVVTSMNEYVGNLPDDTRLKVFMFDSDRWETFYEGAVSDWKPMKTDDYSPGAMTPLFDAVGKAIGYADSIAASGDKIMVMIDTDGFENHSRMHTEASIKALVEDRKGKDWAFMFMSQGLDQAEAQVHGRQGANLGMTVMAASAATRVSNYAAAAVQTDSYFGGKAPEDAGMGEEVEPSKAEPFYAAR